MAIAGASAVPSARARTRRRGGVFPEDSDDDQITNLVEFATGLHPLAPTILPQVAYRDGDTLYFEYMRAVEAVNDGVLFQVEWSDTLEANDWNVAGVISTTLSDDGTRQQVLVSMPAGTGAPRFVRLRVVQPAD